MDSRVSDAERRTVLSSVGAFASEVFRDTQYEVQMPSLAAIRRTLFTS